MDNDNVIKGKFDRQAKPPSEGMEDLLHTMQMVGMCGSCRFREKDGRCIGAPPSVVPVPRSGVIAPGQPAQALTTAHAIRRETEPACALYDGNHNAKIMMDLAMKNTFFPEMLTTQDLVLLQSIMAQKPK